MHVVFGAYDGPIDAKPGEKVVFIGDCAKWKGELAGELVQIDEHVQGPLDEGPAPRASTTTSTPSWRASGPSCKSAKGATHVRLEGCPVSVAEQVLALVFLTGCKNPFFVPGESLKFNKAYLSWKAVTAYRRLMGHPYQREGEGERGEAQPRLEGSPGAE